MVLPLEVSRPVLDAEYDAEFTRAYQEKMRVKLGLLGGAEDGDGELFKVGGWVWCLFVCLGGLCTRIDPRVNPSDRPLTP